MYLGKSTAFKISHCHSAEYLQSTCQVSRNNLLFCYGLNYLTFTLIIREVYALRRVYTKKETLIVWYVMYSNVKNKLMSVFNASVLLLTMNFVLRGNSC